MNTNYKKSVAIFGLVIPLIVILALTAFVLMKASSIRTEYTQKIESSTMNDLSEKQNKLLVKQAQAESKTLKSWQDLLGSESRRSFLKHWKTTEKQFKAKEFIRELPTWQNTSTGIGAGIKNQSASQVTMTFDSTYRAMQIAVMEVETRLPQLQLDSLDINPSKDGGTLNFKTTYTVWTID